MTEEERASWLGAIGMQVDRLRPGPVDSSEVAVLMSAIIARARETSLDTRWLALAVEGIAAGLSKHRESLASGTWDPAGLRLALHSAVRILRPFEMIEPAMSDPSPDLDAMIAACAPLGITDCRRKIADHEAPEAAVGLASDDPGTSPRA